MKNKAIILLIIVVAGFLAAIYLMGDFQFGNEPEELNNDDLSIKSNDESAELTIPKNALPDNVKPNDISVTRVSNSLTENGTLVVYDLEPDGLVFSEEVLFNVTFENANIALPLVIISNGTGNELVNNVISEFYLNNKSLKVSIPLTHFSTLRIRRITGTFSLEVSAPDEVFVGEKVNTIARFSLHKTKLIQARQFRHVTVYEFLEPHVIYKGSWINPTYGNQYWEESFSPVGEVGGKPSSTKVVLGQTNTVQDDTFECVAARTRTVLFYDVEITGSVNIITYSSESDYLEGKVESSTIYRNYKFTFRHILDITCSTPRLIVQGIYTTKHENKDEIYMVVEIHGPANATGFVTLTGSNMEPIIQPVLIGPGGSTENIFIHPFRGEITVFVEVGELNATRTRDFG
jgi:hypothetical protein